MSLVPGIDFCEECELHASDCHGPLNRGICQDCRDKEAREAIGYDRGERLESLEVRS